MKKEFDYQSECHCSETGCYGLSHSPSLITSQNATAPKPRLVSDSADECLITSQNATAPKPYDHTGDRALV